MEVDLRTWVAIVGAAALVAAGVGWSLRTQPPPSTPVEAPPEPVQPSLELASTSGEVTLAHDGQAAPAAPGAALGPGDDLRTGTDGEAILHRSDGLEIRLAASTDVHFNTGDDGVIDVELRHGRVKARVDQGGVLLRSLGRTFTLRQGEMTVSQADAVVAADVQKGEVVVGGVAGVDRVQAGQRVTTTPEGGKVAPIPEAPLLDVAWPGATRRTVIDLVGKTQPGSTVRLVRPKPGDPVRVDATGGFRLVVEIDEGITEVEVEVTDLFGQQKTVSHAVRRDTQGPVLKVQPPTYH